MCIDGVVYSWTTVNRQRHGQLSFPCAVLCWLACLGFQPNGDQTGRSTEKSRRNDARGWEPLPKYDRWYVTFDLAWHDWETRVGHLSRSSVSPKACSHWNLVVSLVISKLSPFWDTRIISQAFHVLFWLALLTRLNRGFVTPGWSPGTFDVFIYCTHRGATLPGGILHWGQC